MVQHARFSPSQLARIMLCPGSMSLCAQVPQRPSSAHASEGTLLHALIQQYLEVWPEIPDGVEELFETGEQRTAVLDALSYVVSDTPLGETGSVHWEEQRVQMPEFPEVRGILDFAVLSRDRVDVVDFKFGRGVRVELFQNPQLLAYVSGFLNMLKMSNPDTYAHAMSCAWYMHVVQPRIGNYQCLPVDAEDLRNFENKVRATVLLATSATPPFHPGEEQCRWCDAGGVCRVRMDQFLVDKQNALLAFADIRDGCATIEDVAAAYASRSQVQEAYQAMAQYLTGELAKGNKVPGYKLVKGRTQRTWKPQTTVEVLLEAFPELDRDALLTAPQLRSPAQVERLLARGRRGELAELVMKPEGKMSLASEASERESYDPVRKIFGDLCDTPEEGEN